MAHLVFGGGRGSIAQECGCTKHTLGTTYFTVCEVRVIQLQANAVLIAVSLGASENNNGKDPTSKQFTTLYCKYLHLMNSKAIAHVWSIPKWIHLLFYA